jgi:hypothetical protein
MKKIICFVFIFSLHLQALDNRYKTSFEGFFAGLNCNFIAMPRYCNEQKDSFKIGCGGWLDVNFLAAGLINRRRNWYVAIEGGPAFTQFCDKTIMVANFSLQAGLVCGQINNHLVYFTLGMIGAPIFATLNFAGFGYGYCINDCAQLRAEFTAPITATFIGFNMPLISPTARFRLGIYLKLF